MAECKHRRSAIVTSDNFLITRCPHCGFFINDRPATGAELDLCGIIEALVKWRGWHEPAKARIEERLS